MSSVNKTIHIGRLGKDPEVRTMGSGSTACNFSIACTRTWKDKQGQKQEETEWIRVALYDKLGDIAAQYLHKGSLVYVEGRLKTRKYEDKNGNMQYSTEIIGDEMRMLGGKEDNGEAVRRNAQEPSRRPPAQAARPASAQRAASTVSFDDMEDDIPY